MNSSSKTRLKKVHPALSALIESLEVNLRKRGINIEVVQGLRTYAEQNALFAQGRTKPGKRVTNARGGQSNHNFGTAVDVAPTKDGKIDWDDEDGFDAIGEEAKKLGLEWGGDWRTFVDRPHLQLPSPPISTLRKLYDTGGLPEVWGSIKVPTRAAQPVSRQQAVLVTDLVTDKPITTEDAEKGINTGTEITTEESAGTPPPAPAVEVKASEVPLLTRLTSLSIPAGAVAIVGAVLNFVKELPPYAWFALGLIIVAAMVIGYLVYRDSKKQAHERTKIVLDAAADKDKNNLRLV